MCLINLIHTFVVYRTMMEEVADVPIYRPQQADRELAKACQTDQKFVKNSLRLDNFKQLFPMHKTDHDMKTRQKDEFQVNMSHGKRYAVSAIPSMQKLLNKDRKKQRMLLRKLKNSSMSPTNFACMDLLLR